MIKRVSSRYFTVKKASWIYGITEHRVQELTKNYHDTGKVLILNPKRRSKAHLSDEQVPYLKWVTPILLQYSLIGHVLHFGLIGVHIVLPCLTSRSLKIIQYRFGSVSRNAKLLAVKNVTQNRGKRTAGIDGAKWIHI